MAAAAGAPPPEGIVFALTPPATAIDGLLNFARPDHHKIYYKLGIKAIENPFDCEADGRLYQFLRDIRDRANQMG